MSNEFSHEVLLKDQNVVSRGVPTHSSNPPFLRRGIGFPENGLKGGGIEDFGF